MRSSLVILLILVVIFNLQVAQCQWGGGWNNGGGWGGNQWGGGYGGRYDGYGGGYGGGFGAQQAYNVQNAARIGTEVAEGVLVAEEVSEAIGK